MTADPTPKSPPTALQTSPTTSEHSAAAWESRNVYSLLFLFPAAFALHVAEESLGFPHWVSHVLHGEIGGAAFYINNAAFMLVLCGLCFVCLRTRSRAALWALFLWVSGQQLCNTVFHVYTQVVFHAYSPGLFTAVFGYVPVYTYLTYLVLRERLLPRWFLPIGLVVGAVGMWFTIWAGLYHFGPFPTCRWAPFVCG